MPISLLVTLLQALVLHATSILGVQTGGESDGLLALLVLAIGTALTLLGLGPRPGGDARGRSSRSTRAGRSGPLGAYRLASDSVAPLVRRAPGRVRRRLAARELDLPDPDRGLAGRPLGADRSRDRARGALGTRRASPERPARPEALAQGRVADRRRRRARLVAGPLIGALLILATDAPFWLVNVIAGVVYAVTMPFVALDDRLRLLRRQDPRASSRRKASRELPAEIELSA